MIFKSLEGKFKDEPLYVDLRWAKLVANLSLRHSQFRPAVLDISSTLLGRPKDELDGEDVQQHRRFRTITRLVIVALTLLSFLLTVGIIGGVLQTREIAHQASLVLATAAQNASDSGYFDRALRFATLATKDTWLSPTSLEAAPQLARAAHASARQAILIHEGSVTSAAFSPDSTKIVTASIDKIVRVWDVTTKKELARFTHGDAVMSVAFSPDSTKIVTASGDRTARVWDISWRTKHHGQELTDRVCREKLIGARHITFQDIKISPILSGRWEEDVCDPPSWFSRLAKNLGFGSKQTGNSN